MDNPGSTLSDSTAERIGEAAISSDEQIQHLQMQLARSQQDNLNLQHEHEMEKLKLIADKEVEIARIGTNSVHNTLVFFEAAEW